MNPNTLNTIKGIAKVGLGAIGGYGVARHWFTADVASSLSDQVIGLIEPIAGLVALAWTVIHNQSHVPVRNDVAAAAGVTPGK